MSENLGSNQPLFSFKTLLSVADQLISKIFGHRQFTSGEINYLVREFGDKNSLDDNFNRILNLNQSICVLTDISNNDLLKTNDGIAKELSNQGRYRADILFLKIFK